VRSLQKLHFSVWLGSSESVGGVGNGLGESLKDRTASFIFEDSIIGFFKLKVGTKFVGSLESTPSILFVVSGCCVLHTRSSDLGEKIYRFTGINRFFIQTTRAEVD
jgi:hypothetical protein